MRYFDFVRFTGRFVIVLVVILVLSKGATAQSNGMPDEVPLRSPIIPAHPQVISLNFQDISVRSVLQLLAEFAGKNIVVTDSVAGNITLHLENISWTQALNIILQSQGLAKKDIGSIILIDKAENLSARETQKLKEQLTTQALAPIHSALLQINYAKASDLASMLKDKTNSLLSERGTLRVDMRTNTLWLHDTQKQINEIKLLISKLDVPVRQVLIEARIVDMAKDCEQDLGVRFGITKVGRFSGTLEGANQLVTGDVAAQVPIAKRLNVDLMATPVDVLTPSSIGVALAKLGNGVLLDLELSAMESEGRAKLIASPRLITTNQQVAVIESGEDIPYQQTTPMGATAVAFKKAVLSLRVTPQITADNKLLLELQITQDADSGQRVQGVPILSTKTIQTNVLVNNGQTIVLGGIYRQNNNNTVDRVPLLGDLPIIGYFFNRKTQSNKNEELLIFITPRIIANSVSARVGAKKNHYTH